MTSVRIKNVLSLAVIFSYTLIVGYPLLVGFPKGWSSPLHLTWISYIEKNWPHISRWDYQNAYGSPFFKLYPPGSHYLTFFIHKLSNISIFEAYKIVSLLSILLTAIGIYFFMKVNFEDETAALTASILFLATPVSWNYLSYMGMFAQSVAYPFMIFSLTCLALYQKKDSRRFLFISIVCYAFTLVTHLFVGFIGAPLLIIYAFAKAWFNKSTLERAIVDSLKVILPGVCLAGFWYFPYLYANFSGVFPLHIGPGQLLQEYIVQCAYSIYSILGIKITETLYFRLAPWLDIFALIGAIFALRRRNFAKLILFLSAVSVFYLIAPIFGITFIYVGMFSPDRLGIPSSISLSMLGGFGLTNLAKTIGNRFRHTREASKFVSLLLICLLIIPTCIYMQREELGSLLHSRREEYLLSKEISENISGKSNRIYLPSTEGPLKEAFNIVSNVSQPGVQGLSPILHLFGYLDGVMCGEYGGREDVKSIVKWFGIEYVLTTAHLMWLFEHNGFSEIWSRGDQVLLKYSNATGLISVDIPSVLIIGDTVAYDEIFLGLIPGGFDPESGYIVRGSEYIDDHSLGELRNFDAVMLYGYKYHDQAKAWSMLEEYVKNGGNLIIDTGYSQDINASYIPAPCPVSRTSKTDFGDKWYLTYVESPITQEINFSFSPAIWNASGVLYPWGVSASQNGSLREWATPVLWDYGQPLVVIGEYGKGRVLWSGLNLPYHIINYRNYWESLFLSNMILRATQAPKEKATTVDYTVNRPHPEEVIVTLYYRSTNVLFREVYFANWHAYLIDADGQKQDLDIYKAGPEFMYVCISSNVKFPAEVVFEYGWTWDEIAGGFTSVITSILLIAYAIGLPVDKPTKYVGRKLAKMAKMMRKWWQEE